MDKTTKESHRANVFLTSSRDHPKCSFAIFFFFFFSEFSYVTYIYFSAHLFISRNHLNTESKSVYYKAEALRAIFCSHTLYSALTKHFYSCNALFIDVYRMAMVSAIKSKKPYMDYKG